GDHPLLQAEARYRQAITAQGVTEDLAAYRHLLIQIHQYLRSHGLDTDPLNYGNPRPYFQVKASNATPLNQMALRLKERGFKLIYLLPEHLKHSDASLLLFPCYHEYYLAISAAAFSNIDQFLDSPVLREAERTVAAQTALSLHDVALNNVVFYGQNFAEIRPLNFKTPALRKLDRHQFPHAAIILDKTIPIYVPFHEAQEEGLGRHHFRGSDLPQRLAAIYARIRQDQSLWQEFDPQEAANISDLIYEANILAYRLIYSTGWYLLHNTAFFYLLMYHPQNVSYQLDPTTHTLSIRASPDPKFNPFFYTLEMPWFDAVPPDGAISSLLRSPVLQVYFRYIYAFFFALEDAGYKYGKDLFSLTYGQVRQLLTEWAALAKLPTETEQKVRKLLWSPAEFNRKLKLTAHQTAKIINFLDTRQGRSLRGCADLVTPPTSAHHRPQKD
ncbi:MAG: hypothetical protein J6Y94_07620, partial [Bacteriovoracaceae bacterium]|nr:hypothetical protein [Bacteriovoracaceae bacterium]